MDFEKVKKKILRSTVVFLQMDANFKSILEERA